MNGSAIGRYYHRGCRRLRGRPTDKRGKCAQRRLLDNDVGLHHATGWLLPCTRARAHLLAALSPQRRLCREPETAGQSRAAYRFPLDIDASIEAAGFRMHRDVMRESPRPSDLHFSAKPDPALANLS
jgi:hypothetical protein